MKVKEFLEVLSNRTTVCLEQSAICEGINVEGNAFSLRKSLSSTVGNSTIDHAYIQNSVLHVLFDLGKEANEQ